MLCVYCPGGPRGGVCSSCSGAAGYSARGEDSALWKQFPLPSRGGHGHKAASSSLASLHYMQAATYIPGNYTASTVLSALGLIAIFCSLANVLHLRNDSVFYYDDKQLFVI